MVCYRLDDVVVVDRTWAAVRAHRLEFHSSCLFSCCVSYRLWPLAELRIVAAPSLVLASELDVHGDEGRVHGDDDASLEDRVVVLDAQLCEIVCPGDVAATCDDEDDVDLDPFEAGVVEAART